MHTQRGGSGSNPLSQKLCDPPFAHLLGLAWVGSEQVGSGEESVLELWGDLKILGGAGVPASNDPALQLTPVHRLCGLYHL